MAAKFIPGDSLTFKGPSRPNSAMGPTFEQFLAATKGLVGAARRGTPLVLAGAAAVIAPDRPSVVVDWGAGQASGTITGVDGAAMPDGAVLLVRANDPLRPLTVKNATGTATQKVLLADGQDAVLAAGGLLVLEDTGAGWQEATREYPVTTAGLAAWRAFRGLGTPATYRIATTLEMLAGTAGVAVDPALVRAALTDKGWLMSLLVDLAPQATDALLLTDGTHMYRVGIEAALLQAPHKMFSATAACQAGSFAEYTHGLGKAPDLFFASLVCQTADQGYNVGQEVRTPDIACYASSTIVGWTSAGPITIQDGGGGWPSVTPSRWQIKVRAWKVV